MIFRRRGRREKSEADELQTGPSVLFNDLAKARPVGGYDDDDRRRDFHRVFLGSDSGRRVLYEILAWSRVFASTFVPGDPHATHWREGGRDIGLRVLAVLNTEPPVPSPGRGSAPGTDDVDEEGVRS